MTIPKPVAVASLVVLITLFVAPAISAQSKPYTPDKGSAERKAITDALRVPVEKRLKQRRPDGGQIDYRYTTYAEAYKAGAFDDGVMALLHKVGGQWRVIQYVIGATDVAYIGWDRKFHAPAAIFPH